MSHLIFAFQIWTHMLFFQNLKYVMMEYSVTQQICIEHWLCPWGHDSEERIRNPLLHGAYIVVGNSNKKHVDIYLCKEK